MFDVSMLLRCNCQPPTIRPRFKNKMFIYTDSSPQFGMKQITRIIGVLNWLDTHDPYHLPLNITLGCPTVIFLDKLSYVLLECLCYYSLEYKRRPVTINFQPDSSITTDGIMASPLKLLTDFKSNTAQSYIKKFKTDIGLNHYRRMIEIDTMTKNKFYASSLVSDISNFLKPFDATERYRNELAEVIGELIDNSYEHAKADCLLDLDVSRVYRKNETGEPYHGINVTVINFSDTLLGNPIKDKLQNDSLLNDRDRNVKEALKHHKEFFSKKYTPDDFYNIASFQDRISGRAEVAVTGGTGLTKVISSLEQGSDAYQCYLLAGDRKILFLHEFLEYNPDGWIGFNAQQNFLEFPPNQNIINQNSVYFQGTAYNLCFAMKKEAQPCEQ